jgi:hypothetical protein
VEKRDRVGKVVREAARVEGSNRVNSSAKAKDNSREGNSKKVRKDGNSRVDRARIPASNVPGSRVRNPRESQGSRKSRRVREGRKKQRNASFQ